jgi:hypothetical protein
VVPHDDSVPYGNRAETTAVLASELAPAVLAAIGLDPGSFDAEIVVGGYRARTNPSVLLTIDGDEATADRAAAAFGHVFGQQAVLVWRDGSGDTLAAAVQLPSVTPNLADHFFRHAAAVEPKLAGGFTARGNALVFINLRGRDGTPLSGLDDEAFIAALQRAAAAFGGIATVSNGRAAAKLVEREAYAGLIGPGLATVERLRARRTELGGR